MTTVIGRIFLSEVFGESGMEGALRLGPNRKNWRVIEARLVFVLIGHL